MRPVVHAAAPWPGISEAEAAEGGEDGATTAATEAETVTWTSATDGTFRTGRTAAESASGTGATGTATLSVADDLRRGPDRHPAETFATRGTRGMRRLASTLTAHGEVPGTAHFQLDLPTRILPSARSRTAAVLAAGAEAEDEVIGTGVAADHSTTTVTVNGTGRVHGRVLKMRATGTGMTVIEMADGSRIATCAPGSQETIVKRANAISGPRWIAPRMSRPHLREMCRPHRSPPLRHPLGRYRIEPRPSLKLVPARPRYPPRAREH